VELVQKVLEYSSCISK